MASKDELTERQRYWLGHVEACERSGQTTKAYAEVHGLSTSMMYSWRKELTNPGRVAEAIEDASGKGIRSRCGDRYRGGIERVAYRAGERRSDWFLRSG